MVEIDTSHASANKNKWAPLPALSEKRAEAAGVWVNDHQFLVTGGYHGKLAKSSCEYYDANTNTWNSLPVNLPGGRCYHDVAIVGNRLFVIGGIVGTYEVPTVASGVFSINIPGNDLSAITENWETVAPMKTGREAFACVSDSRYIYAFGGRDGNTLKSAERYDTQNNTWISLPDMPEVRSTCAAGMVGNKIYVVGGRKEHRSAALATTFIYDTITRKWEIGKDMNYPRTYLQVVTVDRYVVAIGGWLNADTRLSSIEVLDTQRKAWLEAPAPITRGRAGFVAGYLKATDQIIVASGVGENSAEIISFEHGFLPPSFNEFKERGQKIIGDTDHGKDQLDCKIIAEALAESLLFKDLTPPFVLGILGKWGRGKSFFFNLMLDHMIKIQKTPAYGLVRQTYVGHIYVVKFDAWTFSKGCVFSSFMYEILKTLNEELQFEAKVDDEHILNGVISTIEVFRDLSTQEIEYTMENDEVLKRYVNDAKNARANGDFASEDLLKAINASYGEDEKELKRLETSIAAKILEKRVSENLKGLLNGLGKYFLDKALEKFQNEKEVTDETIADLMVSIKRIGFFGYRVRVSNVPPFAFVCAAVFAICAIFLTIFFVNEDNAEDHPYQWLKWLTGFAAPAIPVIAAISSVTKKIEPIVNEINSFTSTLTEELEAAAVDDDELNELKRARTTIKNRTLALKGISLHDTIANKIDARKYQNNLGIVHKVQQDLKLLSDGMLNSRLPQDEIFPRGAPRIVLAVDDLDRCEKDKVVEVIEALQLLVKTKLFVAVLAIDPRYVTTSIENHYEGILNPHIPPSGMDFLEKIIQIPFRLPGVEPDSMDSFVMSQIHTQGSQMHQTAGVEESKMEEIASECATPESIESIVTGEINVDETSKPTLDNSEQEIVFDDTLDVNLVVDSTDSPPADTVVQEGNTTIANDALPKNEILFTQDEVKMMINLFKLFGLGPRCIRRLINVFKMLQIIWKRSESKLKYNVDQNLKCAALFLMVMAADESTREVTYRIFDWMESGSVKFHNVAIEESAENNLASVFIKELKNRDKSFKRSYRGEIAKEGTLVAFIEKYLSEYKWNDFDGWSEVSSKFILARCFSFYRVTSEDDDDE